jgi:hypothetical protein
MKVTRQATIYLGKSLIIRKKGSAPSIAGPIFATMEVEI